MATVQVFDGSGAAPRLQMVKSGSSYLSSSDRSPTFGMGLARMASRVVVRWPSGRVDEERNLEAGKSYEWIEGDRPRPLGWR